VKLPNPFRVVGRRSDDDADDAARARIAAIAARGDARSLTELLPFLPPESHRLGAEASRAATAVIERCSPLELAWFDQWYRGGWVQKGPRAPAWKDVRLGSAAWAREHRGVVALASFHASGFVREVAVRLLAERDDGLELPLLLLRTNDWVAKVQVGAGAAVARRVSPAYTAQWLRCLGLVERLRAARRREHDVAAYVRRVEELLLHDDARPRLEAALATGELPVRRAVLRLTSRLPHRARLGVTSIAERDPDPLVAFEAARSALEDPDNLYRDTSIVRLARHRLGRVRALALATAIERAPGIAAAWLEAAVFDPARPVRELARHALCGRGGDAPDFAALYRARVNHGGGCDPIVALEGLAEVGDASDVPLFERFLLDPAARRRAAAVVGIGRCDGARHLDALEAALRDRSATVRRAATPFARRHLGRGVVQRTRRAPPEVDHEFRTRG